VVALGRSISDQGLVDISAAAYLMAERADLRLRNATRSKGNGEESLLEPPCVVTWRLDRKKPAPKHSDGFLNSSGKGVEHDHRLRESFDIGAES
jgi:hypothetical protein